MMTTMMRVVMMGDEPFSHWVRVNTRGGGFHCVWVSWEKAVVCVTMEVWYDETASEENEVMSGEKGGVV